jgi:hypothetical protein
MKNNELIETSFLNFLKTNNITENTIISLGLMEINKNNFYRLNKISMKDFENILLLIKKLDINLYGFSKDDLKNQLIEDRIVSSSTYNTLYELNIDGSKIFYFQDIKKEDFHKILSLVKPWYSILINPKIIVLIIIVTMIFIKLYIKYGYRIEITDDDKITEIE